MKIRSLLSSLLAIALLVGLTVSCSDELKTQQQNDVKILKTLNMAGEFSLTYPDAVNQGDEITFEFANECGKPTLELWNGEAWEQVDTDGCASASLSVTMEDYGVYSFRVLIDEVICECPEAANTTSDVVDVVVCRLETAYAANEGDEWTGKKAWWYSFDVSDYNGVEVLDVVGVVLAGKDVAVGTVTYNGTSLIVVLDEGWVLDPDCEAPVKVTGYATAEDLPNKRPTPGKMELIGDVLSVAVGEDVADFYVVHLDVKTCDVPDYTFELPI